MGKRAFECRKSFTEQSDFLCCKRTEFILSLFPSIFPNLLIEEAVLLTVQSEAADAMFAGGAFLYGDAIHAIPTVVELHTFITAIRRDSLMAALTGVDTERIDRVLAECNVTSVEAVLIFSATPHEVAVTHVEGMVRVLAVFRLALEKICARDLQAQLLKLREEGTGEIDVAAKVPWIPVVRPPLFSAHNDVRLVGRIERDEWLAALCTRPMVEVAIIAKH